MSNRTLGLYLKQMRKSHKYTQEYVASCLDVIRQSYSHYETGRTMPNVETLNKLAAIFNVPLSDLLEKQLEHEGSVDLVDAAKKEDTSLSPVEVLALLPKDEQELLSNFQKLSKQDQKDILEFIKIKSQHEQV